ncbi:hypothetical protein [Flagellimonas algicola]|uniref:Uncharacterized protein n=1 Tax=Flagellimonas algicola TaxID=2583815 RepID=A0ABY2WH93_9FLAO|nr:hypothetical protein [Allomuricauda algicola]TMU50758.1 hypothetical protein FGG15_18345 [Allomuricauda algicola]
MIRNRTKFLVVLLLIPLISMGQIPDGQFIDADKSASKVAKIKPFIQKDMGFTTRCTFGITLF